MRISRQTSQYLRCFTPLISLALSVLQALPSANGLLRFLHQDSKYVVPRSLDHGHVAPDRVLHPW